MADIEQIELNNVAKCSDKIATGLSTKINSGELKKVLDSKISEVNDSSIDFDISIFDEVDIFSTIEDKIAQGRNRDLLSHPLIEAFLLAKWDTIKFWYYLNTFFYFVFVIDLTILLYFVQFDIAGM
jgi:hypothetical protein